MLKEASLLGNATASYNLGISYEHALGTKKCYKKVKKIVSLFNVIVVTKLPQL